VTSILTSADTARGRTEAQRFSLNFAGEVEWREH